MGKRKLQYFKEIICCIKDEEKTETKTNKTNESDSTIVDESNLFQDSERNSIDSNWYIILDYFIFNTLLIY